MLRTLNRLVAHVCTPDELDMVDHYQTRAERLADLWVHVVGLMLAAVGGVVLAGLAGVYTGIGGVMATAIYALCLVGMLTASTIYNWTTPRAARPVPQHQARTERKRRTCASSRQRARSCSTS